MCETAAVAESELRAIEMVNEQTLHIGVQVRGTLAFQHSILN